MTNVLYNGIGGAISLFRGMLKIIQKKKRFN